jgi:hypothetical protein
MYSPEPIPCQVLGIPRCQDTPDFLLHAHRSSSLAPFPWRCRAAVGPNSDTARAFHPDTHASPRGLDGGQRSCAGPRTPPSGWYHGSGPWIELACIDIDDFDRF